MKIPLFFKNYKNNDLYLGLFLKEDSGLAFIIENKEGEFIIKDKESFNYINSWENLIDDIDEVIYKLEKKLNIQVNKTIFFVYSHLIDELTGSLKRPYFLKIKELVKILQLDVLGYIECFEAVSFYLEKIEKTSLNAILTELDKNQLSIFVYQGEKLHYRKTVARTDNIIDDFLLSLEEIKDKELLPSRIIIYDSDDIDNNAEKLMNYRWQNNYFVQIPKITIFNEEKLIESLVSVFSEQIVLKTSKKIEKKESSTKEFGFFIGQDVDQFLEKNTLENTNLEKSNIFNFKILRLPKISFPKIELSFLNYLKGKVGIFLGLIIILLSLFFNEYFFHKAYITIYLPYKIIEKTIDEKINYQTKTLAEEFEETISTTGKKEIGEKARGSVIIHNFDDKEKILTKGTKFTVNSLEFILDNDVKIASSTIAADGSAKLPGKSTASLTAVNIGEEGNITKGQRFRIDDLPMNDFFAINDNSFSGGSRRQIKIVDKSDINKLREILLNKAKKTIKKPLLSENEKIINKLSKTEFESEKFSKEAGEEGESLSLKAKIKMIYFLYNEKDLNNKIFNQLKKEVGGSDYNIDFNNLNYQINEAEILDDFLLIKLNLKIKAIKNIDKNKFLEKVIGKNEDNLKKDLRLEFKDLNGYQLVIKQPLPFLKKMTPFFKKNIILTVSSL